MPALHLITCEYPPQMGGVSEHSRVVAEAAASEGYDVHVWTAADGASSRGVHVHDALGDFSTAALTHADAALDRWPSPRRLVVQWVPHGYGRKGLNVTFTRWIRRRARTGDRIDLIVHEAFLDFFGRSWLQPAAAAVQRYMTWTMVRAAERVWLTIPGWEPRLRYARRPGQPAPRTLPVPGTIPPIRDEAAVSALRGSLLRGRLHLVGYFGTGGDYALDAIRATVADAAQRRADTAFVCIGRESEAVAGSVRSAVPSQVVPISGTGALPLDRLSLHLQACDALLQPYPDGVSGRRTTTVSALEHAVPVATTLGRLSEPFWGETTAIEAVPVSAANTLPAALARLLEPPRNAVARTGAIELYRQRFDPAVTLKLLLATPEMTASLRRVQGAAAGETADPLKHPEDESFPRNWKVGPIR